LFYRNLKTNFNLWKQQKKSIIAACGKTTSFVCGETEIRKPALIVSTGKFLKLKKTKKMNNDNMNYFAIQSSQLTTKVQGFDNFESLKTWCIAAYNTLPIMIRIICIDKITDEVIDSGNASDFFDLTE
jgi:hypothetical protein